MFFLPRVFRMLAAHALGVDLAKVSWVGDRIEILR